MILFEEVIGLIGAPIQLWEVEEQPSQSSAQHREAGFAEGASRRASWMLLQVWHTHWPQASSPQVSTCTNPKSRPGMGWQWWHPPFPRKNSFFKFPNLYRGSWCDNCCQWPLCWTSEEKHPCSSNLFFITTLLSSAMTRRRYLPRTASQAFLFSIPSFLLVIIQTHDYFFFSFMCLLILRHLFLFLQPPSLPTCWTFQIPIAIHGLWRRFFLPSVSPHLPQAPFPSCQPLAYYLLS